MLRCCEIKKDLDANLEELRHLTVVGDAELIEQRREELISNVPLFDIFNMMWALVVEHTEDNVLTKEGYFRLHRSLQIALHGPSPLTVDFDHEMPCLLRLIVREHRWAD